MWLFPIQSENWMWPNYPGTFGAKRKYDIHTGIDLYCPEGTKIFAVEDGIIVGIQYFTGKYVSTPWWNDTFCVLVKGQSGIINYGEIRYDPSMRVGDNIERRQFMGTVMSVLKKDKGRPTSMLHLELYKNGSDEWPSDFNDSLLDPTDRLKEAALNDFGEIKYYGTDH